MVESMPKYNPHKIEDKWQKKWLEERIYEPDLDRRSDDRREPASGDARQGRPFYNLMMFPYPSAEGLHVGNMYAFTGSDIYGRFKRMQGYDVFEPIGLDGFGIHSENYALKIGVHPADQAAISEKRFYAQLHAIGNSFAWNEHLETYDPEYYRWTQWLFIQMWKHGLAYRKKQAVNWCPKDKTVLADEQVEGGKCERCGAIVEKRELEQWFLKITHYAERLLNNIPKLDWSEKVKIAQKNWIGKSEGALIKFPISDFQFQKGANFVFLHAFRGTSHDAFWPWLKKEIESRGGKVFAPDMPNPSEPNIDEQVEFVLKNHKFDEKTVVVTHSLGGPVAMKLLPKLKSKIAELIMAAPPLRTEFLDGKPRPVLEKVCDWRFDFGAVREKIAGRIVVMKDLKDDIVPPRHPQEIAEQLGAALVETEAQKAHFNGTSEPAILDVIVPGIEVFTTRPDTLFGATYLVLAPEHELIAGQKSPIANLEEVKDYVKKAKVKSVEERLVEEKEKTGVELKGTTAINPANGKEIPIWVADYVLGSYGTGAIMAVPAHDERDFEFAKKYKLPIVPVISPVLVRHPAGAGVSRGAASNTIRVEGDLWEGNGELINSGKFDGMDSEKAKSEITKFVHGEQKTHYRLRDWLISRQRYWGPPIPMIFCEACAEAGKGERADMPGWYAVPESELPVKLPAVKDFRPTGSGKSPLASVKDFYETKCPACGSIARRETDVSDTFLDSAWYYLRYPSVHDDEYAWNSAITKKWLPVNSYIGGAEHSVLHLLYSRFVTMAFHDMGLLDFDEPFTKFVAHGLITKDGAKMSKSKGNVVNPDEYIKKFGADTLRMYLMFLAPFEQGGDFRDSGILGIERFLNRVWRLAEELRNRNSESSVQGGFAFGGRTQDRESNSRKKEGATDLETLIHKTIKKVTEDIEHLHYNTAIARSWFSFAGLRMGDCRRKDLKFF
jgi:leucyl-tRNA synthetase